MANSVDAAGSALSARQKCDIKDLYVTKVAMQIHSKDIITVPIFQTYVGTRVGGGTALEYTYGDV